MLAWELVGAVVGAGLASGREVASFFSQYGVWSWPAILGAAALMYWLVLPLTRDCSKPLTSTSVWRLYIAIYISSTGGAMIGGAGELAKLLLPVQHAFFVGAGFTLLLCWFLSTRVNHGLAMVSQMTMAVMFCLIMLGFLAEPKASVRISGQMSGKILWKTVTYAGFNTPMMIPLLINLPISSSKKRKGVIVALALIGGLLMLANAVLQRHSALIFEPMPFTKLLTMYGRLGYWVSSVCIYLAIVSTLTACIKGGQGNPVMMLAMVAVACLGFGGVIDVVYPLLGFAGLVLLAMSNVRNCCRKPFHSGKDMI